MACSIGDPPDHLERDGILVDGYYVAGSDHHAILLDRLRVRCAVYRHLTYKTDKTPNIMGIFYIGQRQVLAWMYW